MITFPEYNSFDGLGLADLVQRKDITPTELVEAAIERIERLNPSLNAVVYKMFDEARLIAKDKLPLGQFTGVPFLLKDLLADYAGVPLTSGSRFTQHWVPTHDSELVRRFKAAGLIVLGKTNVPEFGLSSVTESELFGPAHNPWNLKYSPGGSSGGSAAAVAAGMVPMAHANDGGGSIRIPASYCGLFGFKPSRGRTAAGSDIMRMWETMVVEHVLTRSVRDSAAMLDVISGPEVGSTVFLKPESSYLSALKKPFMTLQIAVTDEPFFPAEVSPEYAAAAKSAAQLCRDLGHVVETTTLKVNSDEISLAYIIVIAGEISASIKRFSKVLGYAPQRHDLEKQTALLHQIGDHISAADYAWAADILEKSAVQMANFFLNYDVLITPTVPCPPPLIGELKPNFMEQSLLELLSHIPFRSPLRKAMQKIAEKNFSFYPFTPLFNISGQPAMSMPLYWDKQGLPIGVQFAGRYGEEATLFQLASQLEKAKPWSENKS